MTSEMKKELPTRLATVELRTSRLVPRSLTARLQQIAEEEECGRDKIYLAALQILSNRYKGLGGEIPSGGITTFRGWLRQMQRPTWPALLRCASLQVALMFEYADLPQADIVLFEGTDGLEAFWKSEYFSITVAHYANLLCSLVTSPDGPVSRAPYLTKSETDRIVGMWSQAPSTYPRNATVPELFAEQVRMCPEAIAVTAQGASMTYAALDFDSTLLANSLLEAGIGPGKVVALSLQRSPRMVVAMLAVLKCGACYLPLDASLPNRRLQMMVEDAAPGVILADDQNFPGMDKFGCPVLNIEQRYEFGAGRQRPSVVPRITADVPAYIIYTSGSTGNPKGVVVGHRAIVRLVRNTNYIDIDSSDCIAQMANAAFDAITFEVWGALLNGARVEIVSSAVLLSPSLLADAIVEKGISIMFLTTALFNLVARSKPGAFAPLKWLLMGGEAAVPECQRNVLATAPPARMVHVYGPTENTTYSLWHTIAHVPEDAVSIPIGKPISNTNAYVLDRDLQLVPVGVEGELFLGGDGLALGYLNRPELTGERFLPHPFATVIDERIYRTGDRVRYLDNGVIEFLGRTDHQIKLRGHRIELGEIETVLREHPKISDCVVIVRSPVGAERQLAAYSVCSGAVPPSAPEVRAFLGTKLPDYMIPATIAFVESLPLTPSGKVDRNGAFPEPVELRESVETPRGDIEVEVAAIWTRRLGKTLIGRDDNFFDAGGDSLTLSAIAMDIQNAIYPNIHVASLFQYPTIRSLAGFLASQKYPDGADTVTASPPVCESKTTLARKRAAQLRSAMANRNRLWQSHNA